MNITLLIVNYLAVTALSIVRVRRHPFHILDPAWTFIAGYLITYCLRPTAFLIFPEDVMIYKDYLNPSAAYNAGLPAGWVFALLGLAGFVIGDFCFEGTARNLSRRLPEVPLLKTLMPQRTYSVITIFFLGLGVLGLVGFIREAGWQGTLFELLTGTHRDIFLEQESGHGYYTLAMFLSVVGWTLICVKWIAFPVARTGWRRIATTLWRVCCAMAALLIWVAFGERSSMIAVIFIPFALHVSLRQETRATLLKWAPILAFLFVMVAGPIGVLMKNRVVNPPQIINMATSTWDSMEYSVAAAQHYPTRGLFWGESYASDIVYTWYPRPLFPKKPSRYGIILIQDYMAPGLREFPGTFPVGLLVEAFANFWYAGLFLVPLLLAIAYRAVYWKLRSGNLFWTVLIAMLFQQLASFRGLGSVVATMEALLFALVIVMSLCQISRFFPFALLSAPRRTAVHVR
jgi:hypothetical protein